MSLIRARPVPASARRRVTPCLHGALCHFLCQTTHGVVVRVGWIVMPMGTCRSQLVIGAVLATASPAHASNVGFESDVIGWASGGYHGSAWFGSEQVRIRIVKAVFYAPSFTVPDGFERLRHEAWEFFVDVAWRPRPTRFEGLWSGVGLELYDRQIRDESSGTDAELDALELALRTGYIWRPFDAGFYVNPWVGLNIRIDGDASVLVGERTYSAPRVSPLASLKLGWQF